MIDSICEVPEQTDPVSLIDNNCNDSCSFCNDFNATLSVSTDYLLNDFAYVSTELNDFNVTSKDLICSSK
jgi:hypothetical protein